MSDSDTQLLAKAVFFLVIISVFATLVATQPPPGASLPPTNTALTDLQDTLGAGFPTFNNPFAPQTFTAYPAANNLTKPPDAVVNDDPGNVTDCNEDVSSWYGCLTQRDADLSYTESVDRSPTFGHFFVNLSAIQGFPASSVVTGFLIDFQCRENGSVRTKVNMGFSFRRTDDTLFVSLAEFYCYPGAFANYSRNQNFNSPYLPLADFNQAHLSIDIAETAPPDNASVDFSFFAVTYTITEPECSSADSLAYIGCILGKAFTFFVKGIIFLVNGAIWIVQDFVWFLTVLFGLANLLISSVLWIATIPGTPPVVAGIMLAVIGFVLTLVAIAVVKIFRGTGAVG